MGSMERFWRLKVASKSSSLNERTAARRADLIAKGWAQKNWLLPPAALANLAALVEREGCTEAEAVERPPAHRARSQRRANQRVGRCCSPPRR